MVAVLVLWLQGHVRQVFDKQRTLCVLLDLGLRLRLALCQDPVTCRFCPRYISGNALTPV